MTTDPTLEQLHRPHLRGPLTTEAASHAFRWAGLTTLASGQVTVTVSTAAVGSDSLILSALRATTRQSSGLAAHVEVATIGPGGFFTFALADGQNPRDGDTEIMWLIVRT